jgi:NADH-quinone oxidoreductase subunit J
VPDLLATTHVTVPDAITFVAAAAMVLAGAIGVVTARNPVHAALMLVLTLFGIAVLFVAQQAEFLAAVQVIVYAGAIVVLFLFVIMFLGVDRRENIEAEPLRGQRPVALILIVIIAAAIITLGFNAHWVTGAHHVAGVRGGPYDNVKNLGHSLFTTYLLAFEITAALLVIAVVGAVVLARRPPSAAQPDAPAEALGVGDEIPPDRAPEPEPAGEAGGPDGDRTPAPSPGEAGVVVGEDPAPARTPEEVAP